MKWGVAGLALAGCAYVAVLDPNTSTIAPPCPFRSLTGLDCPGCGMTRGLHSLLRGDLVGAVDHNVLMIVAIAATIVWFAARRIGSLLGREPGPFRIGLPLAIFLGITISAFWVLRNLPFEPFRWFDSAAS